MREKEASITLLDASRDVTITLTTKERELLRKASRLILHVKYMREEPEQEAREAREA
ncbi:hypothetical protein D3C81_2266370 [compost metagenome]